MHTHTLSRARLHAHTHSMTRLARYWAAKIFSSAGFCSTLRRISLFLFCAGWQGSESCWQCLSEISNANCVFLDGGGDAIGRAPPPSPDVGPVKHTAIGRWPVELPRRAVRRVRESYQSRSTRSSCWEFLLLVCMFTPRLPIRKIQRQSKWDSSRTRRAALTRWAASTRWAFRPVLNRRPCLFSVRKVYSYLWAVSYSFLVLYVWATRSIWRCALCYVVLHHTSGLWGSIRVKNK